MWGIKAGALALAATAAVSGCGSSNDAKPVAAKPKTVSVSAATKKFQAAVDQFDEDGGCLDQAADTCWDEMQAVMKPARTLRAAMHADKSVGPEFWSGAYALINKMQRGMDVGDDEGASKPSDLEPRNRAIVLGSAHDLSDWLDEHPVE
ncbi:hypothetical protein [Streptomyces sp. NPDC048242]|uniref:hypothetical protein n=1 Tax=Streptomyces sp. NPDC048242 TaxID=3155026 RepID=UPI0034128129